jgi:hypothetical protein
MQTTDINSRENKCDYSRAALINDRFDKILAKRHRAICWSKLIIGTGGSLLYLLSALSLLLGLTMIVGPVLAESFDPGTLFSSLGILYLYELGLLGAAILIVRCRNVTDDSVCLIVLMAIFLGVGGLALETVAHDSLSLALGCGLALLMLGAGKIWSIHRWLAPGMQKVVMAVIVLLLAYGYLGPVAFAEINCTGDRASLRTVWIAGWWILAIAGSILFIAAGLFPPGDAKNLETALPKQNEEKTSAIPFALTRAMGWVFVGVLLLTAVAHQLAVVYLFGNCGRMTGFSWSWVDLLPLASLALLLIVQYRRLFGYIWKAGDAVLLLLPALGILIGLNEGSLGDWPVLDFEILWHPTVLCALIASAIGWQAYQLKHEVPWAIAIFYVSLGVLSLNPSAVGDTASLLWLCSGLLLATGLTLITLRTKRMAWAVLAAATVGISVFASSNTQGPAMITHFSPMALALVAEAIAIWSMQLLFKEKFPARLARLAPIFLLLGMTLLFREYNPVIEMIMIAATGLLMGTAVWFRNHDRLTALMFAAVPLWQGWGIIRENIGYGCVLLAFFFLAIGVALSLRKGARAETG